MGVYRAVIFEAYGDTESGGIYSSYVKPRENQYS